jgi:ABC-type transport system substrate-binding protein
MSRSMLGRRALLALAGSAALAARGRAETAPGPRFITATAGPCETLDPHVVFDNSRMGAQLNLYDGLVRWVGNPPKMQMWLADKIDISSDGLSYTVTLKQEANFHDGNPVTADDVVFSMERILAMKQGAYGLYKGVIDPGNTKALDPHTVQFTLNRPFAVFQSTLSELWVVNGKLVRQHDKSGDMGADWLARNEAGSGGFALRRYDPQSGFQADRFEKHFAGFGVSNITSVEFRAVPDTAARLSGLEKGQFNAIDGDLPQDQVKHLRHVNSVQVQEAAALRTMYIQINTARPPLDNVNVRKALSYAFDYDSFIAGAAGASVARNQGIIPSNLWGAPDDLEGYRYDLGEAKEYLVQATATATLRQLEIGVPAGQEQSEAAARLLRAGAAQIGIDIKLTTEPWAEISAKSGDRQTSYDLVPRWRDAYFVDPHNWAGVLYNSRNIGAGNASFYNNPLFDQLTDKALSVTDQEQRRSRYEEASRVLVEDAAGVFICNAKWFGAFSQNVHNVRYCPIGDAQDIRWISLS